MIISDARLRKQKVFSNLIKGILVIGVLTLCSCSIWQTMIKSHPWHPYFKSKADSLKWVHEQEEIHKEGEEGKARMSRIKYLIFLNRYSLLLGTTDFSTSTTTSYNNPIILWHLNNGEIDTAIDLEKGDVIYDVSVSASGNDLAIAVGSVENLHPQYVGCFSIKDMKWKWKTKAAFDNGGITFEDNDKKILVFYEEQIYALDANDGKVIGHNDTIRREYGDPLNANNYFQFSPNGKYCAFWQLIGRADANIAELLGLAHTGYTALTIYRADSLKPIFTINKYNCFFRLKTDHLSAEN